jgi:synaptobrevin family protein YKT6
MKIYSIIVFQKKEGILEISNSAYDVSDISFFKRGGIKEFLNFFSKTIATNTQSFQRLCVPEKEYLMYSTNSGDLTVSIITDKDYSQRVIFNLSDKVIQDKRIGVLNLDQIIEKYQNPSDVDNILKIQKDIKITKCVMVDNIDKALARGERIDDLIARSDDLSQASKDFYKSADKLNSSCCVIA